MGSVWEKSGDSLETLLRVLPHTTVKKNGYVYSKRLLPREQKATRSWEAEDRLT